MVTAGFAVPKSGVVGRVVGAVGLDGDEAAHVGGLVGDAGGEIHLLAVAAVALGVEEEGGVGGMEREKMLGDALRGCKGK